MRGSQPHPHTLSKVEESIPSVYHAPEPSVREGTPCRTPQRKSSSRAERGKPLGPIPWNESTPCLYLECHVTRDTKKSRQDAPLKREASKHPHLIRMITSNGPRDPRASFLPIDIRDTRQHSGRRKRARKPLARQDYTAGTPRATTLTLKPIHDELKGARDYQRGSGNRPPTYL